MPGENVYDWSIVAANNATADTSINWAEHMPRADVNNSARSMMAAHAKLRNLQNGSITTGGSANVQTVTTGQVFTSLPTGMRILVKNGFTNTASMTLNVDGTGAFNVITRPGALLTGGEVVLGGYSEYLFTGASFVLFSAKSSISAAFMAFKSFTDSNVTGGGTPVLVQFDTEVYDDGGNFSPGNVFTAPVTGRYQFSGAVRMQGLDRSVHSAFVMTLVTPARNYQVAYSNNLAVGATDQAFPFAVQADLTIGQAVYVLVQVNGTAGTADIGGDTSGNMITFLAGHLIR